MEHKLPTLSYELGELEPYISKNTLEFHYGKHHQAYITNLNNLIKGTAFEDASMEDIVKHSEGGIFNNGAQVYNHTFYFEAFKPNGSVEPNGKLKEAIEVSFGSFDNFKAEFSKAGATLFGSGWVWLVVDTAGKLAIMKTKNAGNPLRDGFKPILTMDVWEHAYYLDTQNARPKYIENFWNIINWELVEKRFEE
ncbi:MULTISPECIES: superoxide dismutase [Marinifilum]|jgi:Fe-Mn family superoxide dismutase|uniref:Superoxide dismutase n=1 Tax=Marinifilum flexuosum TaxID=1117708 RepID=A0A419X891_9BACT|nr:MULTISPECIES: superoxide dismutase [Marinifilum]MCY1633042.1 superoxide dismutase [Marinifilum sp. D737]RKE03800.1 Fe-Mn family superoxide dismutase [Marinifilum flexuosum]